MTGAPTTARPTTDDRSNRSLGDLFGDVVQGFSTLLRQELALAKAELSESAKRAKVGVGMLGAAGYAALMTIFFLSVALMWALADAMESIPAAAMVVAVIWAVAAVVLGLVGKQKIDEVEGMPRTLDSINKIPETVNRKESHR